MGLFDFLKKAPKPDADAIITAGAVSSGAAVPVLPSGVMDAESLAGKFLIASPFLKDKTFHQALVYLCAHGPEGALGIVVNRPSDDLDFDDLLEQMNIARTDDEDAQDIDEPTILSGGPVEPGRGFVLHSPDYQDHGTRMVAGGLSLSVSVECLRAIAAGRGPSKALVALGFSGWSAGQLEGELADDGWLVIEGDQDLLFEVSCAHRWTAAISRLGLTAGRLSQSTGRA